jgi:hypothetical protein
LCNHRSWISNAELAWANMFRRRGNIGRVAINKLQDMDTHNFAILISNPDLQVLKLYL